MAIETKATRSKTAKSERWHGAYKWGGVWHTVRRNGLVGQGTPRSFHTADAARKAAAEAASGLVSSTLSRIAARNRDGR